MAAVSAWAKPGAWALDSEENDAAIEHQNQQQQQQGDTTTSDFPSLSAALTKQPKKKKTLQKLSLAEFTTGKSLTTPKLFQPSSRSSPSIDSPLVLPTGPRERTAEELEQSSRRGFGNGSRRDDEDKSRWGSRDERRAPPPKDLGPSRADEVDDWGAGKKSFAPVTERRERSGGFFDSQSSRADESDSWISKKSGPPPPLPPRERRGYEMFGSNNNGMDADTWQKTGDTAAATGGGAGRPRLLLQPRSLPIADGNSNGGEAVGKSKGSNPFGEARPREEVLAEKGQDWKKIDEKLEAVKIEGPAVGRKGVGGEDRTERAWRKPGAGDAAVAREENVEAPSLED